MIDFIDKTSEQSGTPLNRDNLMAMQGFVATVTVFQSDGSIKQTNTKTNHTLLTQFRSDGAIIQTFTGDGGRKITKTTAFYSNGNIEELIS